MSKDLSPKNDNRLVPISEAAEVLGVSIDTIRRWDKKGILHSSRPDGKNRHFSITELEKIKFSRPLTISQVAEVLNISPSTLRRLEEKGLIKPKRNDKGERIYTQAVLVKYLDSQYFMRQKQVQEKILEPLKKKKSDQPEAADAQHPTGAKKHLITEHKVIDTVLGENKRHLQGLVKFRRSVLGASTFAVALFFLLIAMITVAFLMYPEQTGQYFGYKRSFPQLIAYQSTNQILSPTSLLNQPGITGRVLGLADAKSLMDTERTFTSRLLRPFSDISLEVVKKINQEAYAKAVTPRLIADVNDVLTFDDDGMLIPRYTLTFPSTDFFKIPDSNLVKNLNAEFVQGRQPGTGPGELVFLDSAGNLELTGILTSQSVGTQSLVDDAVTSAKLADGAVATTHLADNSVTAAKIRDGAVQTITLQDDAVTSIKIADGQVKAVDLATGAVTTDKISDRTITAVKIAESTITEAEIANETITSSKIKDGTIVASDIGDDSLDFAQFDDLLNLDAATTITLGGNSFTFNLDSTGDFIIADGGTATHIFADDGEVGIGLTNPLALLHVGSGGTPGNTGTGDVYIQNDLEVDGMLYADGTITAGDLSCTDCLDFDSFENTLNLDEDTSIVLGTLNLDINLDSTGEFAIQDGGSDILHFADDTGTITFFEDTVHTLGADETITINASTTASTDTDGVIDLNVTTVTDGFEAINIDLNISDDAGSDTIIGIYLNIDDNATTAADTVYGLYINNENGVSAADALVYLDNSDTDTAVTDAIFINDAGGTIVDALDASDAGITNALNIGANTILGTTGVIDFTDFDVSADGLIVLAPDGGGTGITITPSASLTTGLDVTDSNITNALNIGANTILGTTGVIDFTNFDVSATGITNIGAALAGTAQLHVSSTQDATSDLNDPADYHLVLQTYQNVNGTGPGIGFASTTSVASIGAAIIHDRTSSNSQGSLLFYTKSSLADGADPVLALTLENDQDVVIGSGTAGQDYSLTFDGESNDGVLTWMEDEDRFDFANSLMVDGSADAIQLLVQGSSTQTSDIVVFEDSTGTDLFTLDNYGLITLTPDTGNDAVIITPVAAITDGLDVSNALIVNALSVGANTITGATAVIDFTDFDVSADGLIVLAPDGGGTGITITPSASLTTGLDVTDSNITNALSIGANTITGTSAVLNFNNFDVAASGAITLSPSSALTTAIDVTDTDITNAISIGTNTLAITTGTIGSNAATVIDFLDFDVSADGLIVLAPDGGGDAITVTPSAAITDALDASNSAITNALNIGANTILGTTGVIDFTNFDVSASGITTTKSLISDVIALPGGNIISGHTVNSNYLSVNGGFGTGGLERLTSTGNLKNIAAITAGQLSLSTSGASFTRGADVAVGSLPEGITTADFNGDRYPDLAVVNFSDNDVSILLNDGDGTFTRNASDEATGVNPNHIATADFNGDGYPDLAVTSQGDDDVSIHLNDGDGTFTRNSSDQAVGDAPRGITTADFNVDGFPDLAVDNSGDDDVSILLNNGDGTFTRNSSDQAVGDSPRGITTADFNGDGYPDLAVSNYLLDDDVSILINDKDGTFTRGTDIAVGSDPYVLTAADLNGDGYPDLAVANFGDDDVSILINDKDGTFTKNGTDEAAGDGAFGIVAADLNGDGYPDLAVANYIDSDVSILINDQDGTFTKNSEDQTVGSNPYRMVAADFDADSYIDLAVTNSSNADVSILINDTDTLFYANANTGTLSIGSSTISGGTAVIDFTDFDVSADGLITLAPDGGGDAITVTPSAAITDGLDVSNALIVNALNIGANTILGTTGVIDFTDFDVSADGLVTLAPDSDGVALTIDTAATTANGLDFASPAQTTGNVIDIADANALTTGSIANFVSNSTDTGTRALVQITNSNSLATGATTLSIQQNAAQNAVLIDHNANGIALNIDASSSTANVIDIDAPTLTTGDTIQASVTTAGFLTGELLDLDYTPAETILPDRTGTLASITATRTNNRSSGATSDDYDLLSLTRSTEQTTSGGTTFAVGSVLRIENIAIETLGSLDDSVIVIEIIQDADSDGDAVFIDSNAINASDALEIDHEGTGFALNIDGAGDADITEITASNTAFANDILVLNTNEEDTGGFNFLKLISDVDGSADTELTINQDGDIATDGGLTTNTQIMVDGTADEIQLLVQGHSTQTSNLVVFEQSDGTDVVTISNTGEVTAEVYDMPTTASATVGVININGVPWAHHFSPNDTNSNVFIGANAGNFTLTGISSVNRNVGIGTDALNNLTTGVNNVALGYQAGDAITSGQSNFALGTAALPDLTTANSNIAIGTFAGFEITSGAENIFIGRNSGVNTNTTSTRNVMIGSFTATHISGTDSIMNENVFIGDRVANDFTGTPDGNTIIGQGAGLLVGGDDNVMIGHDAGAQDNSSSNVLYIANSNTTTPLIGGDFSARTVTLDIDAFTIGTGSDTDITFTFDANSNDGVLTWLEDEDQFSFGSNIKINDGSGEGVLLLRRGDANYHTIGGSAVTAQDFDIIAVGSTADINFVTNTSSIRLNIDGASGDVNARSNMIIGSGGTGVDYTLTFDGETNDGLITWMEDEDRLDFSNSVMIDGSADAIQLLVQGNATQTSDIVVFENSVGTDVFNVDNTGQTTIGAFGSDTATTVCQNSGLLSTCSSSIRYKEDVVDLESGLEIVQQLRPVNYKWISRDERDLGFIAEEVEAIYPLLVTRVGGQIEGVKYRHLTALLTKAIQEQQEQIINLADLVGTDLSTLAIEGEANIIEQTINSRLTALEETVAQLASDTSQQTSDADEDTETDLTPSTDEEADGEVTLDTSLTDAIFSEDITFAGALTAENNVDIIGKLIVRSDVQLYASLIVDTIHVAQALNVNGDTTLFGSLTVEGKTILSGETDIKGELSLSEQQAGIAAIPRGGRQVEVTYSEPFVKAPLVQITPLRSAVNENSADENLPPLPNYWISSMNQDGFTITLADITETDISFNWLTLSVEAPTITQGQAVDIDNDGIPDIDDDDINNAIEETSPAAEESAELDPSSSLPTPPTQPSPPSISSPLVDASSDLIDL